LFCSYPLNQESLFGLQLAAKPITHVSIIYYLTKNYIKKFIQKILDD
jgi:hypothetical protein